MLRYVLVYNIRIPRASVFAVCPYSAFGGMTDECARSLVKSQDFRTGLIVTYTLTEYKKNTKLLKNSFSPIFLFMAHLGIGVRRRTG